jgi:integrase/recombinase XerD
MFDQLFERSKALARQRNGPLLNERLAYLTHMAGLGTARNTLRTIARYLLTVAEVLHLARRPGERITRTEIREQAARWANRVKPQQSTPPSPTARPLFIRFATAWLRFLDRLLPVTPPAGPYDRWVQAFADDLRQERGLNAKTVSSHSRYVLDFLGRIGVSPEAWPRVTLAEIEDALREKLAVAGYARNTASHYGEALRAFFRFAQRHGWCRSGLAEGILLPRIYQQERIPSGPSWDVVQRLIQKIQGDRPNDLLIVARPKSGRSQTFPLCRSVGAAILRYLREARPRSPHRPIFLHGRAPYAPLRSCGVTSIVSRRFADLGVPLTRCGSHALRHACATHLLEQGLSLKEIGDHLGHRHPETTRIYTKVDVPQLRRVADIDLGELL